MGGYNPPNPPENSPCPLLKNQKKEAVLGFNAVIVETGTTIDDVEEGFVAVGEEYTPKSGNTLTMELYFYDEEGENLYPWTDSGTYDVYILLYKGPGDENLTAIYKVTNVDFSPAETTISANNFTKVNL